MSTHREPENVIEQVEVLRMALREAANTFRASPRLTILAHDDFLSLKRRLAKQPALENALPQWLLRADSLTDAVTRLPTVQAEEPLEIIRQRRMQIEVDFAPLVSALEEQMTELLGSCESIRAARVKTRLSRFFRRPMEVEQRALQALALGCNDGESHIAALWRNALVIYPALAAIVEKALPTEISYSSFVAHLLADGPPIKPRDISDAFIWSVLGSSFLRKKNRRGRPRIPTQHSREVAERGKLFAADLLEGQLVPPIGSLYDIPPFAFALRARSKPFADSGQHFDWITAFRNRLRMSFDTLKTMDQTCGDQQFVVLNDGTHTRVRPFGTWSYCSSPSKRDDDSSSYRGDVLQPPSIFSEESLNALEALIAENALEASFQCFFERHPEFLQALGPYGRIRSQVVLTDDTGDRLIPDFFLENCSTGFSDICDLKRPNEVLIKMAGGRPQFRDRLMAGVRQLNEYRDFFESRSNRRRFEACYPGLRAFRPRVILVIGCRQDYYGEIERLRLESELGPSVILRTYDEIVSGARRWKDLVSASGVSRE